MWLTVGSLSVLVYHFPVCEYPVPFTSPWYWDSLQIDIAKDGIVKYFLIVEIEDLFAQT